MKISLRYSIVPDGHFGPHNVLLCCWLLRLLWWRIYVHPPMLNVPGSFPHIVHAATHSVILPIAIFPLETHCWTAPVIETGLIKYKAALFKTRSSLTPSIVALPLSRPRTHGKNSGMVRFTTERIDVPEKFLKVQSLGPSIRVPNDKLYLLNKSIDEAFVAAPHQEGGDDTAALIEMFHKLHCVVSIVSDRLLKAYGKLIAYNFLCRIPLVCVSTGRNT
jgi:hypothetical protein